MTGVAADASKLYVSGNYGASRSVETYSWTGSVSASPYINNMTGAGTIYDIGFAGGLIWVACDGADSPVKAYNTAGAIVDMIPGSIVENAARGVDFDDLGFLWVSNPTTDKIYKIDLTQGVEEGPGTGTSLSVLANPFESSAVITGAGFGDARIEIFDLCGRIVAEAPFGGSYTWNAASEPAGTYLVVVSDGISRERLSLVRLQ